MSVKEITPDVDPARWLAGAQFVDAYRIAVEGKALDARKAATKMFARAPRWVDALLRLRNLVVAPFGLKTSGDGEPSSGGMIGLFPVLSETPERLVAGFNDSHLDFRVVVDVASVGSGQQVTTTTLVLTHNLLGRAYLAVILPFHRLIARSLLRQVAS
jgi:Protein of unknown function (DUF2867)